jgi:hypothetical protein
MSFYTYENLTFCLGKPFGHTIGRLIAYPCIRAYGWLYTHADRRKVSCMDARTFRLSYV